MTLSIPSSSPVIAAQAALLDVALQSGTVATAQVLKLLDANLVRIAIASLTLDVATTVALQPGQILQLAVTQTKDGLKLTPIRSDTNPVMAQAPAATSRGAAVRFGDIPLAPHLPTKADPARPALTPVEVRAVAVAAQTAAAKQSGLSPLFANLTTAVASGHLSQPVAAAAVQLLALRQPSDKTFSGSDIKAALAASGVLLEPLLAARVSFPAAPDIKNVLIVLRQALATWLGAAANGTPPQAKEAAPQQPVALQGEATSQPAAQTPATTRSPIPPIPNPSNGPAIVEKDMLQIAVNQMETADPVETAQKSPPASATATMRRDVLRDDTAPLARNITTPPPFRNALPTAQPVAASTLPRDSEPVAIARQLIADTDGALARQTLLQIASLPEQIAGPHSEATQPRWNFEIPFVTPQGTAMAQFEITRDGGGQEADAVQRVWRARFSLDIEPAGPVHALISFSGDTTSVKMWAERLATAAQLRANATQLGAALDRAALRAGDIIIAEGAPTRARAPSAGHFLSRAS